LQHHVWLSQTKVMTERVAHRVLIIIALLGLASGTVAYLAGHVALAHRVWATATLPVVIALAVSIARDLLQGRVALEVVIAEMNNGQRPGENRR
jgi:hypothetical protein